MKRPVQRTALAVLFACASAGMWGAASAATSVYVQAGPPPVLVRPMAPGYAYPPAYAYDSREYDHFAQRGCGAHRWDPNERYMPGQAVWRNGHLYVATEESAHVYNVNSPPEWTPQYWVRARCR